MEPVDLASQMSGFWSHISNLFLETTLKILRAVLGIAIAALSPIGHAADAWPTHPIQLIVPLPPGGGGDMAARIVSAELSQRLGQSVIVMNKPGASSVVGTTAASTADPDGYTFLFITDFHSINAALNDAKKLPAPLRYDSVKGFTPVAKLADLQILLLARAGLNVHSVAELVALAKKPGMHISAASPGFGSPHHLAFKMLQRLTNTNLTEVFYSGSGPATSDLMGGQVDLAFSTVGNGMQMATSGRVVPLGVSGPKRDQLAPTEPTIAETVPGFAMVSWFGIVAPAGTPKPIVARMNKDIQDILRQPDVVKKLGAAGMTATPGTPEDFAKVINSDIVKTKGLIAE
jgi:tripartite-type tricarboxylate transporter receptor subunit TctC